jgi:hypothetical protein
MSAGPMTEARPVAIPIVPELRIYTHSSVFYLWPLWAVGYLMAMLTLMYGVEISLKEDGTTALFYPGSGPGVTFTVTLLLVMLITNVAVRGVWSIVVVLSLLFITVLFAYLGWWDTIIALLPKLSVFTNLGFYVFFATVVFAIWILSFFVYDRMSYWRVTPGQVTYEVVVGGGQKSYDTRGMVVEKYNEDLFRHWILGFGSGDIHISTTGARREEIVLNNVIFVDYKIRRIQQLINTEMNQEVAV